MFSNSYGFCREWIVDLEKMMHIMFMTNHGGRQMQSHQCIDPQKILTKTHMGMILKV